MIDKYAVPGLKVKSKKRSMRKGCFNFPSFSGDVYHYIRQFDMMNSLKSGGTVINGKRV